MRKANTDTHTQPTIKHTADNVPKIAQTPVTHIPHRIWIIGWTMAKRAAQGCCMVGVHKRFTVSHEIRSTKCCQQTLVKMQMYEKYEEKKKWNKMQGIFRGIIVTEARGSYTVVTATINDSETETKRSEPYTTHNITHYVVCSAR